jgi:diaminopimelate decarboxylase
MNYKEREYSPYIDYANETVCSYQVAQLLRKYGDPLHILFEEKMCENIDDFQKLLQKRYRNSQIMFAVKSYCSHRTLDILKAKCLGVDVCSSNELSLARQKRFTNSNIVINGNAKTDLLLKEGILRGVLLIADSLYELDCIADIAKCQQKKAQVLIRLSGFSANSGTDDCISTACQWTKFGVDIHHMQTIIEQVDTYQSNIDICGFHIHVGSQITESSVFLRTIEEFVSAVNQFVSAGHTVKILNIGGGFPLSYVNKSDWEYFLQKVRAEISGEYEEGHFVWNHDVQDFHMANGNLIVSEAFYSTYPKQYMLDKLLNDPIKINQSGQIGSFIDWLTDIGFPRLYIEPGRSIVGDAGITISTVNGIKEVCGQPLLVLNMGCVNYAGSVIHKLYNKWGILNQCYLHDSKPFSAFICGNLCYNGDIISKYKIDFQRKPKRGDVLITYDTGATESHFFASHANLYPIPTRLVMNTEKGIHIAKKKQKLHEIVQ